MQTSCHVVLLSTVRLLLSFYCEAGCIDIVRYTYFGNANRFADTSAANRAIVDEPISGVDADSENFGKLLHRKNVGVIIQQSDHPLKRRGSVISQHFILFIDASQKCCIARRFFHLYKRILLFKRDIADDIHLGVTGNFIRIAAREHNRVSVNERKHIRELQTPAKFIEQNNVLPFLAIKRMRIVGHAKYIPVSMLFYDTSCFSNACFAPNVSYIDFSPLSPVLLFK